MKKLTLLLSIIMCSGVWAQVEILRPTGTYQYNSQVEVTKKRSAETVNHTTPPGVERMNALKKSGFSCIRKNQINSICQKIEAQQSTPEFVQNAVDKYLNNGSFFFAGDGDAVIVHDGASTEWLIHEDVIIGSYKLNVYKLVKNNKGQWYAAFPVSDEQGIANIEIKSVQEIGLPLILESKINGQTVAYFVTAHFKK